MKKISTLFLLFVLIFGVGFSSDTKLISSKLKKAVLLIQNGRMGESLPYIYDAIMYIKNNEKFKLSKLVFIEKEFGYGEYIKKDVVNNTLRYGDPFYIYMEPVGYKIAKTKDGYFMWVSEDAMIKDKKSGKILFFKENWVTIKKSFPYPTIPFYITNRVSSVPRGDYIYTIIIKDMLSGKRYEKTFEFHVK